MTTIKLLPSFFITALLLLITPVLADTVKLKQGHPDRHIVTKGDTLWDISAKFLESPWRWPEIWNINTDIKNPHLIYPGDIIILAFVDGKPVIKVERKKPGGRPTIKLSPQARASKLDEEAVPTLSSDMIKQFIKYSRIISKREMEEAAYIVASEDGGLMSGSTDKIYARNINQQDITQYDVVRKGKIYKEEGRWNDKILGYEMLRIADARIEQFDDPSTLLVTDASREILIGDLLLPATFEKDLNQHYLPHSPENLIQGKIIAVLDGISRVGQFNTVVLNLGTQDNIEVGHVLAIYQSGKVVRDTVTDKWNDKITLPDIRAGTLMIVNTFENLSYALIMEANRDIHILDAVTNP